MNAGYRQKGIALLIVMWAVVLLGSVVATYVLTMRTESRAAATHAERVEAQALAEGAMFRAIHTLLEEQVGEDPMPVNGSVLTATTLAGESEVRVFAEAGRIDLNRAPAELLTGLARAAGSEEPEAIAARIMDWRDRDEDAREGGAEDPEYRRAGRPNEAADRPFKSTAELHQILGVTRAQALAMQRLSTVYNRSARLEATAAGDQVLRALPGVTAEEVERYLADGDPNVLGVAAARYLRAAARTPAGRRGFFTVEARGVTPGGIGVTVGGVVLITRTPAEPFVISTVRQDFEW